MKDLRPYLLQAYHQWLDDSNTEPHVVCKNGPDVKWPKQFQDQDMILFNISAESVTDVQIDDSGLSFRARFNTVEFHVFTPLNNVLQLRSRDGSFAFNFAIPENEQGDEKVEPEKEEEKPVRQRPKLTLVKG